MFSSFDRGVSFPLAPQFNVSQKFEDYFRCYPVAMMPDSTRKDDANFGGKIFLPPSALNRLTMLHIRYPMLFQLSNENNGLQTHSGVLEFVAEEGRVYLPQWMMSTLILQPGSIIRITNCDVPLGKFVKIEPQSTDFLDISDPKAVLENVLRKFSTLTVDDIIEINYNEKIYAIKVLEVKPESDFHGICVIETDLETDFAPPVGYVEPDYHKNKKSSKDTNKSKATPAASLGTMAESLNYTKLTKSANQASSTFQGDGKKLSGRSSKRNDYNANASNNFSEADLNFTGPPAPLVLGHGQLFFGFPYISPRKENIDQSTALSKDHIFTGKGQSLRQSKKRKDNKNHHSPKPKVHSPEVIEVD